MIIRSRPQRLLTMLLSNKGSVLKSIRGRLALVLLVALLVTLGGGWLYHYKVTLTFSPFLLMGLPLAIFLGFRNSVSYDRFWEGRNLWGELLIVSRNLARQALSLPPAVDQAQAKGQVYRVLAFVYALKDHLRGGAKTDLSALLPAEELAAVEASPNRPNALLLGIAKSYAALSHQGQIAPDLMARIDDQITRLSYILGGCERIKSTPIPYSYLLLLHRTVFVYCLLLPFGLIDTVGYLTPVVVLVLAYTFFGLDALGDEIEDPFDADPNDLPLDAISRNIEINLKALLGESPLPAPLEPKDRVLL
ncbi:bestrophin family protein [Gallaecimonas xiamenensis]|uniref:Bestrophin family membrane protein n=1 Tax=Gallaecimonas xiamenensis 3-C-1 TaxID=745411 RepID=K2K4K8_9GAMM|nr:bestrophin family ion channel [Gallaecimonas xiamenensis]EKE77874.1 bestrophin family membrane protein [Gallaecimonas xiamenensis 3-C-1]